MKIVQATKTVITYCVLYVLSIHALGLSSPFYETTTPPLLDVPTYSLATEAVFGNHFTSNTCMNILTYATPVSILPDRIWSIGLYKGTATHENFAIRKEGVLQLLKPQHAPIVKLLGGSSSKEVDKAEGCKSLGFSWIKADGNIMNTEGNVEDSSKTFPCEILPDCAYYLKLSLVGDLIDCGNHDVALCKVESMIVADKSNQSGEVEYLNTALLRKMNIISNQGRLTE